MAEEAKVRVRLDTKAAQNEMRGLTRQAAATASRVSGGIRSAMGTGIRALGVPLGVGAAAGLALGATRSGVGDVVSDFFRPFANRLEDWALGDKAWQARARTSARQETINRFGFSAGVTGDVDTAKGYYMNALRARYLPEERGRHNLERSLPSSGDWLAELMDQAIERLTKWWHEQVDYLINQLKSRFNPLSWFR